MKTVFIVAAVLIVAAIATFSLTSCKSVELSSAMLYIQQSDWNNAKIQLKDAIEKNPKNAEAHYLLGEVNGNQQNWAEMSKSFDNSLAISNAFEGKIKGARDKYWVTNFNMGVGNINNEKFDKAVDQFNICTVIDQSRFDAYVNLGLVYVRSEKPDEAIKTYLMALELQPENKEVVKNLIVLYFQKQNFEKVVELEKEILANDPDDTEAVVNLAMAYDNLGQSEKAETEYQKILERNPNDTKILFNLGRLRYMNKDYDSAIELFERVVAADPEDYDSVLNISMAYLNMAENYRKEMIDKENSGASITQEDKDKLNSFYERAIPYLEKCIELNPQDPIIWQNLGIACANVGNAEKAKECFDKAESLK